MITLIQIVLIFTTRAILKCRNPVKISIIILFISINLFFRMNYSTGKNWFRAIFILLFIGGILIIFIILASLIPNEKNKKIKVIICLRVILFNYLFTCYYRPLSWNIIQQNKWLLNSSRRFFALITIILIYFFLFIFFIKVEKLSMRSLRYYV